MKFAVQHCRDCRDNCQSSFAFFCPFGVRYPYPLIFDSTIKRMKNDQIEFPQKHACPGKQDYRYRSRLSGYGSNLWQRERERERERGGGMKCIGTYVIACKFI